jgi:hypothetical protein
MAEFCKFWRLSPAEYWELSEEEFEAMFNRMKRENDQLEYEIEKAKSSKRR